ncbi:hypothetical protein CDAR_485611 [Caerostris darwini]|uniref:Uncharacterized protein n=1 Tax=Caerostris darwini TaxID=1538125 RepID=A0AAV4QYH9_9ARAC|nr:hypothetical protein CDAR_485611 [Caerostris darwini]
MPDERISTGTKRGEPCSSAWSKLIIRRSRNPAPGFAAHNSQCEREVRSVWKCHPVSCRLFMELESSTAAKRTSSSYLPEKEVRWRVSSKQKREK